MFAETIDKKSRLISPNHEQISIKGSNEDDLKILLAENFWNSLNNSNLLISEEFALE